MSRTVLLPISDNQGYAAEQVETHVTLQSMLDSIQDAIEQFGADAKVVLTNGQRYGAGFGRIVSDRHGELEFTDTEAEDEDHEW